MMHDAWCMDELNARMQATRRKGSKAQGAWSMDELNVTECKLQGRKGERCKEHGVGCMDELQHDASYMYSTRGNEPKSTEQGAWLTYAGCKNEFQGAASILL